MTGDRWRQLTTIFHAARAREADERSAYLDRACGGDASLRAEVESLLAANGNTSELGDAPAADGLLQLSPGTTLGQYRVEVLIGAGGMGEVYRAKDPRLGRDVAIKILPPDVAGDAERLRRFEQEARAVAALNHPNIVTIYSVEAAGDLRFLTMELIEGKPLTEMIPRHGLPLDRLLDLAVPLADAVGAAHARGIVHRDLKPANVMVTSEGRVKILDFGLAKLKPLASVSELTSQSAPELTADGAMLGTVAYMSPEQAEGRAVDQRSDLFSLGVVLFELATGQRPFKGDTTVSLVSSLLKDTPPAVTDLRPELPRELGHIVKACLQKDPERRYQSAKDLRNELQTLKEELASGELRRPSTVETGARPRLRAFARIAAGLAALIAIALAYLVWRGAVDLRSISGPRAVQPAMSRYQYSIPVPEPVTTINDLSLSPDGSRLLLAGADQLWMYDLTSGSWGRIKGIGTRPQYPFWSPDGQFIAYFQFPPDRLMKIPATGGVAETICTVASLAWGGSWGADSTIVFAQSDGIFRVPAGGGDRIQVTQVDAEKGEVAHEWPHFLPDGRHFTYYAMGKPDGLYLASVDPREPRREFKKTIPSQAFVASGFLLTAGGGVLRAQPLSPDGITVGEAVPLDSNVRQLRAAAGYRAFAASPTVLAYSTDSAPRRFQFALIDRARQEPSAVGPPVLLADQLLGEALTWSLSPDGLSVAFTEQSADRPGSHLGLLDVTRGVTAPLTEGHTPRWAPSGDRIVFTRGDEKGQDLFVKRLGTDSEVRVGDSNDLMKVAYDWHPDGRTILSGMPTPPKMHYTFWLLGADGDPKPRQWFPVNVFRHVAAQFSPPDGRWVAYESYESGAAEVYVRRFPSGDGKEKISRAGGRLPRWRPDGKALFYLQDDMLMEVDLQVGATVKPGVLRPLFKIGNSVGYAVHPDGKRFVLCRPIDPIPPPTITIVLNWAAGLKPK